MVKNQNKSRPPRVYIDKNGRYIKIGKKKVYIKSGLTNNQIVRIVINNFKKTHKSKNKKRRKKLTEHEKKEHDDLEKLNKATGKSLSLDDLAKLMFHIQTNNKDEDKRTGHQNNQPATTGPQNNQQAITGPQNNQPAVTFRPTLRELAFEQGLNEYQFYPGAKPNYMHRDQIETVAGNFLLFKEAEQVVKDKEKSVKDKEKQVKDTEKRVKYTEKRVKNTEKVVADNFKKLSETQKVRIQTYEKNKKTYQEKIESYDKSKKELDKLKEAYENFQKKVADITEQRKKLIKINFEKLFPQKKVNDSKTTHRVLHIIFKKLFDTDYDEHAPENTRYKLVKSLYDRGLTGDQIFSLINTTQKTFDTLTESSTKADIEAIINAKKPVYPAYIPQFDKIPQNLENINKQESDLETEKLNLDAMDKQLKKDKSDIDYFEKSLGAIQKGISERTSRVDEEENTPIKPSRLSSLSEGLTPGTDIRTETTKNIEELEKSVSDFTKNKEEFSKPHISQSDRPIQKNLQEMIDASKRMTDRYQKELAEGEKNIRDDITKTPINEAGNFNIKDLQTEKDGYIAKLTNIRIKIKEIEEGRREEYHVDELAELIDDEFTQLENLKFVNEQLGKYNDDEEQLGSGKKENGLYNDQIEDVMDKYKKKGFKGTYAVDELDKIPVSDRMSFIVNTDKHDQPGQHWQAVYIDARPEGDQAVEFYDSYADDPSPKLLEGIKNIVDRINPSTYLKLKHNKIKQQSEKSSSCGVMSMKFLLDRYAGKPFNESSGYSDVIKSEKQAKTFRKQHGLGREFGYI